MHARVRSLFHALGPPARLATCLALLTAAGCGGAGKPTPTCAGGGDCTRILFLGNSYTYVNDLPSTFAQLAWSGGHPVEVAMVANGGETLAQHSASSDSLARIASGGWKYVVLQEQSDTPASATGRDYAMYPAARALADKIDAVGAAPMFFMTWAHQDGEPSVGLPGYAPTQQAIDNAYLTIAHELRAPVAPVGYTWYLVRQDHPEIEMWQSDGSHPTSAGTYLAACVFYAAVFRQSPAGLGFHGGVTDDQAGILQDEAGRHVLDMQAEWDLN